MSATLSNNFGKILVGISIFAIFTSFLTFVALSQEVQCAAGFAYDFYANLCVPLSTKFTAGDTVVSSSDISIWGNVTKSGPINYTRTMNKNVSASVISNIPLLDSFHKVWFWQINYSGTKGYVKELNISSVNPKPTPTNEVPPSKLNYSYNRRFYSILYTISADPNAISAMKSVYNDTDNAYDIITEDTNEKAWVAAFPDHRTMKGFAGLKAIDSQLEFAKSQGFTSDDFIFYDLEKWEHTSIEEQATVADSIAKACDKIHAAGYKCAITPQLLNFHPTFPNGTKARSVMEQLPEVDYSKVDMFVIMAQRWSRYSLATEEMKKNVNWVLNITKGKNDKMLITVQFSFRQASNCWDYRYDTVDREYWAGHTVNPGTSCVIKPWNSVQNLKSQITELSKNPEVDGVMIIWNPRDATTADKPIGSYFVCPKEICSVSNLKNVMLYIESFKKT